jgi:hypothetical protein
MKQMAEQEQYYVWSRRRKRSDPLDLYLMGMIDKSKVPSMLLIENLTLICEASRSRTATGPRNCLLALIKRWEGGPSYPKSMDAFI